MPLSHMRHNNRIIMGLVSSSSSFTCSWLARGGCVSNKKQVKRNLWKYSSYFTPSLAFGNTSHTRRLLIFTSWAETTSLLRVIWERNVALEQMQQQQQQQQSRPIWQMPYQLLCPYADRTLCAHRQAKQQRHWPIPVTRLNCS